MAVGDGLTFGMGGVGEGVVGAYLADMGLGFRGWHH